MFSALVLIVSCVVLSGAHADLDGRWEWPTLPPLPECGVNEVLNYCVEQCRGEDSCYDRDQIACPQIVLPCIPACVCKEGFIRKTLGSECIPNDECPGPCEIFTHYSECKENVNEVCPSSLKSSKSIDNEKACTQGCVCWPGYYRKDENSPCQHRCWCPELRDSPECEFWWRSSA